MFHLFRMSTVLNNFRGGEQRMEYTIGKRIKERRKSLKMSQETLAKKSNVCRARISAIENGNCGDILVSTISAIAIALDTTVEFFLT